MITLEIESISVVKDNRISTNQSSPVKRSQVLADPQPKPHSAIYTHRNCPGESAEDIQRVHAVQPLYIVKGGSIIIVRRFVITVNKPTPLSTTSKRRNPAIALSIDTSSSWLIGLRFADGGIDIRMVMLPPSGVNLIAFDIRLRMTCSTQKRSMYNTGTDNKEASASASASATASGRLISPSAFEGISAPLFAY